LLYYEQVTSYVTFVGNYLKFAKSLDLSLKTKLKNLTFFKTLQLRTQNLLAELQFFEERVQNFFQKFGTHKENEGILHNQSRSETTDRSRSISVDDYVS